MQGTPEKIKFSLQIHLFANILLSKSIYNKQAPEEAGEARWAELLGEELGALALQNADSCSRTWRSCNSEPRQPSRISRWQLSTMKPSQFEPTYFTTSDFWKTVTWWRKRQHGWQWQSGEPQVINTTATFALALRFWKDSDPSPTFEPCPGPTLNRW